MNRLTHESTAMFVSSNPCKFTEDCGDRNEGSKLEVRNLSEADPE